MGVFDDELRNIDDYVEAWNKVKDYYWKKDDISIALDIESFVDPISDIVDKIWNGDSNNDVYNYGMKEHEFDLYHKLNDIDLQLFYYLKNNNLWDEITNYFDEQTIEYLQDITSMNWIKKNPDPQLDLKTKYNLRSIYGYREGPKWIAFKAYFSNKSSKKFKNCANSIKVDWKKNKDDFFKWFDQNWTIIKDYCVENYKDSFRDLDIKIDYGNPVPNIRIYESGDKIGMIDKNATTLTKDAFVNLTNDKHKYPIINTSWKFKIPTMLLTHKNDKVWNLPDLYLAVDPTWLSENQICVMNEVYSKPKAGFTYAWVISDWWWENDGDEYYEVDQDFFDKQFENFYLKSQIKNQHHFQILQCDWNPKLIKLDDYH